MVLVRGLGFGHTKSIPTDTELQSALGFCFAPGLERAANRKGKP